MYTPKAACTFRGKLWSWLRGFASCQPSPELILLTLVEMIDADLGVSYLPEMAGGSAILRNTKVRMHPMRDRPQRSIGFAWRTGSARVEEFRFLGDFIKHNR